MTERAWQIVGLGWVLVVLGATALHAKPLSDAPSPWFGLGPDGGLVLLTSVKGWTVEDPPDAGDPEASALKWLGTPAELVGVDHIRGLVMDAAVADDVGKGRVGERLEVVGRDGQRCTVEVTSGVRALLSQSYQFENITAPEPGEAAPRIYQGPGLRHPWNDPVDEYTEILTAADIERDPSYSQTRLTALRVKRIEGTCPIDGLAGPVGRFVYVAGRKGEPEIAAAVRAQFRANKWIKKLTKEFLSDLKEFGASSLMCESDDDTPRRAVPKHLDEGYMGLQTTVFEPPGQDPLVIAATGHPTSYCDRANAAIAYRQRGKKWVHLRDLWGYTANAIVLEVVAVDTKTKRVWMAGWETTPGMSGWVMRVTALDKPGMGSSWGDWPDVAAHLCNYSQSLWEYSTLCHDPRGDTAESSD